MPSDGIWADAWAPGNTLGLVTSISSALFLVILFWWLGVSDPGIPLASLSSGELLGGLILGLLLGGGTIAIHAKPAWRERWRTDLRLRVVISLPLVGVIATSLVVSPPVVFLGTAIMAVLFVPARTYLYLAARAGIDTRAPTV